jgi:DNA-binding GntR family transcriptional regulator
MVEMNKDIATNSPDERQEIGKSLKLEIVNGALSPGQRLVEMQLCERFGVTRSKIREALRQLEQDGFVRIVPNVGAVVSELSQKDIEHIYDLLAVLEGLAVKVGTLYLTPQHLESLQTLIDKMEATDEPSPFYKLNNQFHALLDSLSENERLMRFADNLRLQLGRFSAQVLHNPLQMPAAKREHRKIFEAIKGLKAAKADQLVRDHYLQAKNRLIKRINKSL